MRALAVILIAVLAVPGAIADAGSTQTYIAAGGDAFTLCNAAGQTLNVGGACFDVTGWTAMGIEVVDASGLPVAVSISFEDANGNSLGATAVCSQGALRVPAGATTLFVGIGQAVGPLVCGPGAGAGTTGTIRAFPAIWVGF